MDEQVYCFLWRYCEKLSSKRHQKDTKMLYHAEWKMFVKMLVQYVKNSIRMFTVLKSIDLYMKQELGKLLFLVPVNFFGFGKN
jgi:hypothetical protein